MFRPEEIALLLDPRRWRIVSTACGVEAPLARDQAHRHWRLRHTHAHPHRELMLALAGETLYGHPHGVVRCPPGTLLQFDPMEPHDLGYPPWVSGARHLWCYAGGGHVFIRLLEPMAGNHDHTRVGFALRGDELGFDPLAALERISALGKRAQAHARLDLLTFMQAVVSRVLESGRSSQTGSHAARAVEAVRQHVRETAGAGVTLQQLAALAGYSRFHLVRLFRQRTGMGLRAWIDSCRLDQVRRLRQQGAPLGQAATELGFSSSSALSRWCRRHGVSWRDREGRS